MEEFERGGSLSDFQGQKIDGLKWQKGEEEAGDIHGFLSEDEWGNVVDPSETEWSSMSGDWELPDNEETDIMGITSGRAPLGEYEDEDEPEYHDMSNVPDDDAKEYEMEISEQQRSMM